MLHRSFTRFSNVLLFASHEHLGCQHGLVFELGTTNRGKLR
jgi:hypothetical protein